MVKHYLGEAGTLLLFDTGILVGSVNSRWIKYKDPSGVEGTWVASLYSSYSNIAQAIGTYFISYTLLQSNFTKPGEWKFQPHVAVVDGTWFGETVTLKVFDAYQ
jgi:hypothetical protein